jgi:hypothetical protein
MRAYVLLDVQHCIDDARVRADGNTEAAAASTARRGTEAHRTGVRAGCGVCSPCCAQAREQNEIAINTAQQADARAQVMLFMCHALRHSAYDKALAARETALSERERALTDERDEFESRVAHHDEVCVM